MLKRIAIFMFLLFGVACLGGYLFVTNYGEPGSGVSMTEVRDLEPFEKVCLEEFGTINVSFGETQSVSVTTDDNLVGLVETVVKDGELHVRPLEPINPKVDLVIDVVVPRLTHAELAGAASLHIHDIQGESLDIELAGACGVDATGSVDNLNLELAGACRARLGSLEAKNAKVEIAGTGSIIVYASESIDAEANGFAKITCHGNPQEVQKEANGISSVKIVGT